MENSTGKNHGRRRLTRLPLKNGVYDPKGYDADEAAAAEDAPEAIESDVLGSYTGVPLDAVQPVQDVDDL